MSRNSCVMKSPLSSGLFCRFAPKGISNALIFLIFCRKTQGPGLSRRHTLAMTLIMAAFCKPIHFGSWFSESAIQSWPYVGESHEQNHPTPIASANANLQGNWVSEAKEMVSLTKEVCEGGGRISFWQLLSLTRMPDIWLLWEVPEKHFIISRYSQKRRDRVGSTFQFPHICAPPMISHAQPAEGCSQLRKLKHKTIQEKKNPDR